MYPITRESVMAAISSSVAEKAVCWCDGRKKRRRRIVCRLTHLVVDARVIGGLESRMAISAGAARAWNILSWCKTPGSNMGADGRPILLGRVLLLWSPAMTCTHQLQSTCGFCFR